LPAWTFLDQAVHLLVDKKVRALVVEDDTGNALELGSFLSGRFSIDVEIADDLVSARAKLEDDHFDMITLDCRLPDGPGIELLDEITALEDHPPVIMVTGNPDQESAVYSLRSAVNGFVMKNENIAPMLSEAVERSLAEITLRRTEDALADERLLMEAAIEVLPDTFFVLTFEEGGRGIRWNSRLSEATGWTDEEIATMTPGDFFDGDDLERATAAIMEVSSQGRARVELLLKTKDGRKIPYEYMAGLLKDRDGNPVGFCGIGRDISDRRDADASLQTQGVVLEQTVRERTAELEEARKRLEEQVSEQIRSEKEQAADAQYFRSLFENSMDVIAVFDENATLLDVSPSVRGVLGHGPEDVKGRSILEVINAEDIPALWEAHEQTIADNGVPHSAEVRMMHPDGNWRIVQTIGSSFEDASGAVRIVVHARDITAQKQTEEEMLRLNQELDGYAQTVSHDLRTPLTSIKMASDALQKIWARRDEVDDIEKEIARVCEVIKLSTSRAERLIDELLNLARAGQEPESAEEVDISDIVDEVLEECLAFADGRSVKTILDDDLGTVYANRMHVYQIFSNLVGNAIKYNDTDETVVTVSHFSDGANHFFEVKDNGSGIPEEMMETLFLPFVKGREGDTGVGLAIVKKLVSLYGGEIRVHNEGGAVFDFSIEDRQPTTPI